DRGLERLEEPVGQVLERGGRAVGIEPDPDLRDRAVDPGAAGDEEPDQEDHREEPARVPPGDLLEVVLQHVDDTEEERESGQDDEPVVHPLAHPRLAREEALRDVHGQDRDQACEDRDPDRDPAPEPRRIQPQDDADDRYDREEQDENDRAEVEGHWVRRSGERSTMWMLTSTTPMIAIRIRIPLAMSCPRMEPRSTGSRVR